MVRFVCFVLSAALFGFDAFGGHGATAVAADSMIDDVNVMCETGEGNAALLVHVQNIRSIEGNLRAQIYSSDPEEFLEKGKKLLRVDVPVAVENEQSVCVRVPAPGTYALVIMHDKNANGKADFFSEGFGFSNNPKLGFGPPAAEDVMISIPVGVSKTTVVLKYILGSDEENVQKRRKLKRG